MAISEKSPPNEIKAAAAFAIAGAVAKGLASQPSVQQQIKSVTGIAQSVESMTSVLAEKAAPGELVPSVTENVPEAQFLDSQMWKVAITVTNHSPPVTPVLIPGNYIHELVLQHSILDPTYWKGSMIITSNRLGILEGKDPDENINLEMLFRGDGKDEVLIEIVPLFADVELPPETWNIKSEFIVYDTEDIPWKENSGVAKKIYFWHKAYNILLEKNPSFSTASYVEIEDKTKATNEDRMLPVGTAIQKLLEDCGLKDYIDYEEWDPGNENAKIFYTSSSGGNGVSCLYDLLPYCVSEDLSPGLLYFHRGKEKFQLVSLKSFFEKAGITVPGEYYYETFYIGVGDSGEENTVITPNKTPIIKVSKLDHAISMKKYNTIQDYSYTVTEPSGADSMESMISSMNHTYDHKKKRFNIFYKDSEIKQFKTHFKKTYTDKLLPGKTGDSLITLNSSKKKQDKVSQRFEPNVDKTLDVIKYLGRNYLTLSTLYLNLGINFSVQGSTHRHPGRFIGLEKAKNSDNKYDFRLLGQWLVTDVTLRWQKDQLYNELLANKVSTFTPLKFNEDA